MADKNWLVQSCCNPAITGVVAPNPMIYEGAIFQDSLKNCYTVIQIVEQTPTIIINEDDLPLYKDCLSCISNNPCPPPYEDTKTWLVQSCCDKGITKIIADNILVPGDIFQDVNGDCYTVLMASEGAPNIVRSNEFIYKTCEDCGKCIQPSPSVTPTVTQTPFPTPSITPSVTITPSPTTPKFVNSSPSPTPTATVSKTPSVTPSINTPVCKCITYINTSISNSYQSFYTTCDGFVGAQFSIAPQQTIQVCGSNPSAGNPAVTFYTGSYCQNEECVAPDISPSPTPTPSATLVTVPVFEPEPLCMDIVFGPAPSPSATPSKTVSATPSVTVSTSTFPLFPSLTPTSTPSVTPSITPTKTPSISITPSITVSPSITPSITPTRTVTPTISVTKTPTASVTPTKTPTPTPSVSSGALVVPECSVIYLNNGNGNKVYSYNSTTNISTLLNLGTSPTIGRADDIAHTTNKLWLYDNTGIFEYNITLTPFTSAYNRKILLPVGISLGAGLCAVNDTTLISSVFSPLFSVTQIVQIALNPDNTTTISNLFSLPSERIVSGDIVYTTDGKIIVTTQTTTSPFYFWISQYIPNATGGWDLEFEKDITVAAPFPWGLAIINNIIYIFSAFYSLIQINNVFPYNTTQGNITNPGAAGSSQIPSCCNVSFQPNIIGASPSPTPTPTKTVTPSITASPSITPTRTPTPTPSKSPPNNIPCTGTGTLPLPGNSVTYNGVTITISGTGNISLYPNAWASCNTTTPANTAWLGLSGAFTYILTFSQPVNNIRIPITGLSTDFDENIFEIFTFTTSGGTPTITSPNNCFSAITGNQISSNGTEDTNNGGGLFTISSPSSFNTLTITGPGGSGGSLFGIDCTSILPAPPADCVSCTTTALPNTGNGTLTVGNLTINTTYSGPSLILVNSPSPWGTCTNYLQPGNSILLAGNDGAFTYILNFNQPVNNIKFLLSGGGQSSVNDPQEIYTVNTSGGVPTLSSCGPSCATTYVNNQIRIGYALPYGGCALTQVKATNPYTQIIITGGVGTQFMGGVILSICLDTATPLPSPSPSVTPTVTKSPSKTPSVTATPSISVSKTPSVTPSKTATPSITISPSRTPSITPSSSPPSAACPLIYMATDQTYNGTSQSSGFYNKNYTWNPNTNTQQEIILPNDIAGFDIASTGTKLWKSYYSSTLNKYAINEWNLSGNPPYTATFGRTLIYPPSLNGGSGSPGLTAKDNNTLIEVFPASVNGQLIYQVYEINIPTAPATQLTATFKFNLNSSFRGQGDSMLTSDVNGNPDKFLLVGNVSNPTPGTTNNVLAVQQYDYNTGAFEYQTILNPQTPEITTAGIGQFNNTIYAFGYSINTSVFAGYVWTINPNPPYNWTLVNSAIRAGGANSILSCSKGKLVGPNASGCDTMLYRTQTKGYGSYNFTTNTSTVLNVAPNPNPSADDFNVTKLPITIANTSNKMWVFANDNPYNTVESLYKLRESNITLSPFTSTFNRNISLPISSSIPFTGTFYLKPGAGLIAVNNTTLITTFTGYTLLPNTNINYSYTGQIPVVELTLPPDGTPNPVATYVIKFYLPTFEICGNGMLLTSANKLIILTSNPNYAPAKRFINQYNYITGELEFRKEIDPTISVDSGLAEVNGNIYIMGFNIYKIDTISPYRLTLIQSPGIQLINSSQLISCIDTSFPTTVGCTPCNPAPLLPYNPVTYNNVTIIPSYVGPFLPQNGIMPFSDVICDGPNAMSQVANTLFLGFYAGDFTYTLTFSQPVNNIKLLIAGVGLDSTPTTSERFTFNTSGGTPNITSCKNCGLVINNNQVSGTIFQLNPTVGSGGYLTLTAPSNYNILTISGPGGVNGSTFSICSSSIVPAPGSSPSPSPTPSKTPTPTPSASPPSSNTLGCVYYNFGGYLHNYNPLTNTSGPQIQLSNLVNNTGAQNDTHTSNRFWQGGFTLAPGTSDTFTSIFFQEWRTANNPLALTSNRIITLPLSYGAPFTSFAIDNDTMLVLFSNNFTTTTTNFITSTVHRINIVNNTITSAQITPLFTVGAVNQNTLGFANMLLTTTNKLLFIGTRSVNNVTVADIYQYSYPNGVLEGIIPIPQLIPNLYFSYFDLFESNGNIFLAFASQNNNLNTTIYQINPNPPYNFTLIGPLQNPPNGNPGAVIQGLNSSLNCNTVHFNIDPNPSPSPTPTPSPSAPSSAFRTIYKYLDIQLT